MVYRIFLQNLSWYDLVWLYAEAELHLAPAYVHGRLYGSGVPSPEVQLFPDRVVDHPVESDIQLFAHQVGVQGLSVPTLHWLIAERRFAYNSIITFYP